MCKTIFIAWVHGVGKTTLCKKIANQQIIHIQASQLLWNTKTQQTLNNKPNIDELRLQWSLIISKLKIEKQKAKITLFEWHFALYSNNWIVRVDETVFEQIGIHSIVLLTDKAEQIHSRLISRDPNAPNIKYIKYLQQIEVEHAKYVASKLNIEYIVKDISTIECDWLLKQIWWGVN